ncbi:unnamed protein product, partial [Rotaria sordida]
TQTSILPRVEVHTSTPTSNKLQTSVPLPTEIQTFDLSSKKTFIPATSSSSGTDIINILLLGETGVGKSTFINAFVNYLTFASLQQAESGKPVVLIPVSFLITIGDNFEERMIRFGNVDNSSNEDFDHPGQSVTQRCKSYVFHLNDHDNKKLRIIDTPGFGDTRGIQQDDRNIEHILEYVNNLTHLNAICFLLNPNASRLNVFFRSCLTQLFSLLDQNALNNIIFCFTNSRSTFYTPGDTAPLLKKMLNSLSIGNVPFKKENTFCFDSESFRYLVALQNGISFNNDEKHEYEMSWSTSVTQSNRLIDYIRRNITIYRIDNNLQSMKHAQFEIMHMISPMLETMRNILRNLILYRMNSLKTSIELRPKVNHQSTTRCRVCKPIVRLVGNFPVAYYRPHVVKKDCFDIFPIVMSTQLMETEENSNDASFMDMKRTAIDSSERLGFFYNAYRDCLLEQSNMNKEEELYATYKIIQGEIKHGSDDQPQNLLRLLSLDEHLTLSILLRLTPNRIQKLSDTIVDTEQFIGSSIPSWTATHIITGIEWGTDLVILLQLPTDQCIASQIDDVLDKLLSSLLNNENISPLTQDEEKVKNDSNLRFIYADFSDCSFELSTMMVLSSSKETHENILDQPSAPLSGTMEVSTPSFRELELSILPSVDADTSSVPVTSMTIPTDETINILLLGETGVGKSTFINAFANYLTFNTLEEAERGQPVVLIPVSFIITIGDNFEEHIVKFGDMNDSNNEDFDHPGQSITQYCRSYIFHLNDSDRKKLCIIDTPGFGDTRGIQQDDRNIEHILEYVNNLTHLNAICFLLKPNESKLNIYYRLCITQLFSVLDRNNVKNIIFCFTNSRSTFYTPGDTAPLLKKMLNSLSIGNVSFKKENTFCFDSESFRYLVALKNEIQFSDLDKEEYVMSWIKSVTDSNRLIQYICEKLTDCRI